jgi:hypothetical protein
MTGRWKTISHRLKKTLMVFHKSSFIFFLVKENEPKENAVSRALRVRLRIGAAAGRAETRPAIRGAQTVDASISATAPMRRPRNKREKEKQDSHLIYCLLMRRGRNYLFFRERLREEAHATELSLSSGSLCTPIFSGGFSF